MAPGSDAARPTPIGLQHTTELVLERINTYLAQATRPEAWVVGVFGEWGSGKSTLLAEIARAFPNVPIETPAPDAPITLRVEFNAWRYEREEHLLVPLLRTIERTLDDYATAINALPRIEHDDAAPASTATASALGIERASASAAAAAAAQTVAARPDARAERRYALAAWVAGKAKLAGLCAIAMTKAVKIKAEVPFIGSLDVAPAEGVKAVREELALYAKAQEAEAARDAEPVFDAQSFYYNLFNQLRKLTRGDEKPDEPRLNLVFLVDDLDRCLPEKAVEMLESIKLFLDVQGCVFVLAVDDEVVERGIAHRYRDYLDVTDRAAESIAHSLRPDRYKAYLGRYATSRQAPITGAEYLEKIVQLAVRLPRFSESQVAALLRQHAPDLFVPSPPASGAEPSEWLLDLFREAVPPVPRKLIRAADLLTFVRQLAERQGVLTKLQPYTLAQMTLLQVFAPQMFRYLSRRDRLHSWTRLGTRLAAAQTAAGSDVFGASFFDWWEKQVEDGRRALRDNPADTSVGASLTQLERYEEPFIAELRQACTGRSGFDPRKLFLPHLTVDSSLRRYINLLADDAATPAAVSSPMPAAPVAAQAAPATPSPASTPPPAAAPVITTPAVAAPAAPTTPAPAAAPATLPAGAPASAAPRELGNFVDLLLSPQEDSWHGALDSEPILQGRVLDRRAFVALRDAIQSRSFSITGRWLNLVGAVLSDQQVKELLVTSRSLAAEPAGVVESLGRGELVEAVCRKLRPWDAPVNERLTSEEIGLASDVDATRREWAYRYRRGLIDEPVGEQESVEIWRGYQPFVSTPVRSVREIRPGAIAISTLSGCASVWSSAFRGDWVRSGQLAASAPESFQLTALGRFHVAGFSDSTVAIWHLQPFGHWQLIFEHAVNSIRDLAVLSSGRFVVLAGSSQLVPFWSPSRGTWKALPSPVVSNPITGVAALDPGRFVAVGPAPLRGDFGEQGVTMTPVALEGPLSSIAPTPGKGVVATFGNGQLRLQQIDDAGLAVTLASAPSLLGPARIADANGSLLLLRTDEAFEVWSTDGATLQRLGEGPLPSGGDGVRAACLLNDGRVASASPLSGVQVLRPAPSSSVYEFDSDITVHSRWRPAAAATVSGAVLTHPSGIVLLRADRAGDGELDVAIEGRLGSTPYAFLDVWPLNDTHMVVSVARREGLIWSLTTGEETRFPVPFHSVSAIVRHGTRLHVATGNSIVEVTEVNDSWDTGGSITLGAMARIDGMAASRDGHLLAWHGSSASVVTPAGQVWPFSLPGPVRSAVPVPANWRGRASDSIVLVATGQPDIQMVDLSLRTTERWLAAAAGVYAAAGAGADSTLAFSADGTLNLFDGAELRASYPALLHGVPGRLQIVDDSTILIEAQDDAWYGIAVRETGALRVVRMLITAEALVVQDLTASADATALSPQVSVITPLHPQLRDMNFTMPRRMTRGPFDEVVSAMPFGEVARNLAALVRRSGELAEPSSRPDTISWRVSTDDESRALALTLRRP